MLAKQIDTKSRSKPVTFPRNSGLTSLSLTTLDAQYKQNYPDGNKNQHLYILNNIINKSLNADHWAHRLYNRSLLTENVDEVLTVYAHCEILVPWTWSKISSMRPHVHTSSSSSSSRHRTPGQPSGLSSSRMQNGSGQESVTSDYQEHKNLRLACACDGQCTQWAW